MENENMSNSKFIFMAIFLITLSSFCAFLIGYGINSGSCPACKDKTVVKLFTTVNNVVSDVDYNMLTSEIKRDLVGKYVNQVDQKSYLEIFRDGSFEFVRNSCYEYETFTNDDYVLLIYYARNEIENIEDIEDTYEIETDIESLINEEPTIEYETKLTLIPKGEITTDSLIDSMITFNDAEVNFDGISTKLVGPVTCSTSNVYIKE